ncbi:hypothetical protein ANRL2_02488 [Anaerolineae bacterium]|nr:hypothetical protein ANRL2_02488 [Anaerolineae bacterium]
MFYVTGMPPLDATSPQNRCTASADPVWMQQIIEFLCTNLREFETHEHVQFVFNRAGDQVQADYSIKSIKLR